MTAIEKAWREYVVYLAQSYIGCKESDGSHKKIVDLYNSHKPLARSYTLKYTDSWCSGFASAIAIKAGLTDIIPIIKNIITRFRSFSSIFFPLTY